MKKSKNSLFKTLTTYTIGLFLIFCLTFLIIGYTNEYIEFNAKSKDLKETHLTNVKEKLKWEVNHYVELIHKFKENRETLNNKMIQVRIKNLHFMMTNIYEKFKNTKSKSEIKNIFLTAVKDIQFPNNSNLEIFDTNGMAIAFEKSYALNGKNIFNLQNMEGKYIVKDLISLAQNKNEGFYSYKWKKSKDDNKEVDKLSYIKLFEPFGWIISTGIYKDDLEKIIQKEILNNIEQMKLDATNKNYIFIATWEGISLTYPAKGKNMYMAKDKNGLYIVQELIKTAKKGSGFVQYVMPSLQNERNSNKISYVQGLPKWQWYVGAGVYVDDINEEITKLEDELYEELIGMLIVSFILTLFVILSFLLIYKKINKKINRDFFVFIKFFNSLALKNKKIDSSQLKFNEFDDMAFYANKMLDEKIQLEDYLEKYKKIVSTSGDFLSLVDNNYVYLAVNDTYLKYFEKSKDEIIGHSGNEIFGEEDFLKYVKPYYDRVLNGESFTVERWVDFPSSKRFLQVKYFPYVKEDEKKSKYFVVAARDITDEKLVEEKLQIWEKVFSNTSEAVMICDKYKNIVDVNNAFVNITKYSKNEAIGQKSGFINYDCLLDGEFDQICSIVDKVGYWRGEIKNKDKLGKIYPSLFSANSLKDEEGNIINYVAVFSDISNLKESEKKLEFLAHHDSLTNLPNRVLSNDRIGHAIKNAKRENSMIAVCFIDLDNFKKINDSFGHSYGDDVLKECSKRITGLLREVDTLSRIGGDEFVLLLEHLKYESEVKTIINKIQNSFEEPFVSKNQKFFITASIGVSFYPQNGLSAEELIKNSDIAMYKAKDDGRNTYKIYTKEMSNLSYEAVNIENALKDAIKEKEFIVYYQPQINLKTKEVIGAEALIRWNHPQRGILAPINFISLAEDTKMIIPIGEFVLRQSCIDFQNLKDKENFNGKISINVSGIQIDHSDFLQTLQDVIYETKIDPNKILLEITESVIMNDPQRWIDLLRNIKSIGVQIAIDDFGTGYSSLNYLRKLPVDKLKIDMSFVKDIPYHEDACSIVDSIINLSDNMKMSTLAEGIETKEQEIYLAEHNCEEGQGYLYAKPMPLEKFIEWIKTR